MDLAADGTRYTALANRAYAYLARAGGKATRAELARELFGPTARGPLWVAMLDDILAGDGRFERIGGDAWAQAGLGAPALALEDVEFVVLDVESTGLKPWRQRVIEVAALRVDGTRVTETFATLVNPGRRLPRYLHELAGFTQADLAAAPPFAAIADDLLAFLGGAVLVGHGLALDVAYLQHELSLLGRPPLASVVLDTLGLAARLLPGRRKPTLDNLAGLLGLPVARRHRALADARLVAALFAHLLTLARAEGARTLADLLVLAGAAAEEGGSRALLDSSPLPDVPERPGVYLLRDASGRVLYVGKAVNLRERLATYFSRPPEYVRRMEGLLEAVADYETVALGSELEALLVEARLIAAHCPPYNVQRQAKRQPAFIRLDLQEEYPRLAGCAERADDGARYYGPLRNGRAVRDALRQLSALFPLRTCRRALGKRSGKQPPACAKLGRGRCLGPCAGSVPREEYRALAEEAASFLDGNREATLRRLRLAMAEAVAAGDRSQAAALQRQLLIARLFALPGRGFWVAPSTARLAVVLPSAAEGSAEAFAVYDGRYAGQLRLSADADPAATAQAIRALVAHPPAEAGGGEANILLRWAARQSNPPLAILPDEDGDWQATAREILSLARAAAPRLHPGAADGASR